MEWLIAILSGWVFQETIKEVTDLTNNSGGTNMLGGLPVEMITMLGSSVLGGVMSIWGQSINDARTYENKGFQWTRRIIALSAVASIIVWPKIAPVFFDTTVILTWTEFTRGFLFLIESKELVMDKSFNGLIITPLDTHLMSAIIGLYFGGSLVKK